MCLSLKVKYETGHLCYVSDVKETVLKKSEEAGNGD